jgi:integrase
MARPEKREPGIYPRVARSGATVYDAVAMFDGKQKWSRGHETKKKAIAARDEMRVAMRSGQLGTAPARLTVGEFLDRRYLPSALANVRSERSRVQYEYLHGRVKALLGDVRLVKLTPLRVEEFKDELRSSGLADATQHMQYSYLRRALDKAVLWQLIGRNPCDGLKAPSKGRYEPPNLDMAVIGRLIAAADATTQGTLIYMAIATGMRWGELTALRWEDIDFGSGTLFIPKAKTNRGRRTVALGANTLERLKAHRMEQMRRFHGIGAPPPPLVFENNGKPWRQQQFRQNHWLQIRKAAGMRTMRFHDMRHAQATLLARAGVNPAVAQSRLGHTQSSLTLDLYTHLDAADQAPAAAAVEGLIEAQLSNDLAMRQGRP